jgi:hypothetical protein
VRSDIIILPLSTSSHVSSFFLLVPLGADLPTYTKVPGDMMFSTAAAFGFVTGILCIGRGLVNFTIGNK